MPGICIVLIQGEKVGENKTVTMSVIIKTWRFIIVTVVKRMFVNS